MMKVDTTAGRSIGRSPGLVDYVSLGTTVQPKFETETEAACPSSRHRACTYAIGLQAFGISRDKLLCKFDVGE